MIKFDPELAYCIEMGYDAEMNGANTINCHFNLFATPEHSAAWDLGKTQALMDKIEHKQIIKDNENAGI